MEGLGIETSGPGGDFHLRKLPSERRKGEKKGRDRTTSKRNNEQMQKRKWERGEEGKKEEDEREWPAM